jgi:hypothetical protein
MLMINGCFVICAPIYYARTKLPAAGTLEIDNSNEL